LRGSLGRAQATSEEPSKAMMRITKSLNGRNITFLFDASKVVACQRADAEDFEFGFKASAVEGH
jgi:hypothetical protein